MQDLAIRMKRYELPTRNMLTWRSPVILRVDGRAFHTYTKGFSRPFDAHIIAAMIDGAKFLFSEISGCKLGYVQSDEASFLITDFDELETQPWFGYDVNKMTSISASAMTGGFYESMHRRVSNPVIPQFDSRVFNVPREDVANYFLWRVADWQRNSVQMLARSMFSHKQLNGLNIPAVLGLMESKDVKWEDLPLHLKNGTFLRREDGEIKTFSNVAQNYRGVADICDPFLKV